MLKNVRSFEKSDLNPESLVIFSGSESLRGLYKCYCLITTLFNFGCIYGFQSWNKRQILKFKKSLESDQDSEILEQEEQSWSLKM